MYRTPKFLKAGNIPFCQRGCWRQWNSLRDMSHLRSAAVLEKRGQATRGEANPCWRGGRYIEPGKGYVMVRPPAEFQAMARKNGYVLEHRLVVAQSLDRCLLPAEVVHHVNHQVADNRIENLKLYANHAEHYNSEHAAEIAADNSRTCRTASYHLRVKGA
jgi:hypothetical protein